MKELAEHLKAAGVLKTPAIIAAFEKVDRKTFVPQALKADAYVDAPLPIGSGQTISQPYTVAFMLELLQPQPGQKVLDVGFGSGWTTALLASITGSEGFVWALEIAPEVYEFGKANLEKFHFQNIKLLQGSGWEGVPKAAPFDRILVSAAAEEVPKKLLSQLAVNGRMAIPVDYRFGQEIRLVKKLAEKKFGEERHPGFVFVPLMK